MDVINKTSIEKNVGIPIEEDNETMIYLVDNESLVIHTRESLIELYKDTNLFDDDCALGWSCSDRALEANNFWEVLKIYEEWGSEDEHYDFGETIGMTWVNHNFYIRRIA